MKKEMTPEPLKGKEQYQISVGKFCYVPDIRDAVSGLIKFHEDRIEELIKEMLDLKEVYFDSDIRLKYIREKINQEYESIMAIEHWLEDVI